LRQPALGLIGRANDAELLHPGLQGRPFDAALRCRAGRARDHALGISPRRQYLIPFEIAELRGPFDARRPEIGQ